MYKVKKFNIGKIILSFAIFSVLLLGLFLRFANLADNPPSLNWDEVAFAYNAHSIIETGKDEFGKRYPLYFRSLEDYKLPVYVYMSAVSESVFGYGNFAVRFPSALFGSLTVLLVLVLAYILSKNIYVSLLSSFIFAIMPWHVQFSRMAAESTVGLFFFLLGLILFILGVTKRWLIPISIIFLFISSYTYLSFRFIVPILLIILIFYFRKYVIRKSLSFYLTLILIVLFSSILIVDIYAHRSANRSTGLAAVNNLTFQHHEDISELVQDGKLGINIPRRVFHDSHLMSSIHIYANGYLSIFSPTYLFFNLQQSRHYTPGLGLLYVWMLPFLLIGLFNMGKQKNLRIILISLILIAPIPTAYAFDNPNAIRTILLAVPFSIATAFGLFYVWKLLRAKYDLASIIYLVVMVFIVLFFLFYFYHQNSIHLPNSRSSDWQYGRKEMTEYLFENKDQYENVIVSTELEWPNIFYLYYLKYDPSKYLSEGGTRSGKWDNQTNIIENMQFRIFNFSSEGNSDSLLFVGTPEEFPSRIKPVHVVYYLDGKPAIYFVKGFKNKDDLIDLYKDPSEVN